MATKIVILFLTLSLLNQIYTVNAVFTSNDAKELRELLGKMGREYPKTDKLMRDLILEASDKSFAIDVQGEDRDKLLGLIKKAQSRFWPESEISELVKRQRQIKEQKTPFTMKENFELDELLLSLNLELPKTGKEKYYYLSLFDDIQKGKFDLSKYRAFKDEVKRLEYFVKKQLYHMMRSSLPKSKPPRIASHKISVSRGIKHEPAIPEFSKKGKHPMKRTAQQPTISEEELEHKSKGPKPNKKMRVI